MNTSDQVALYLDTLLTFLLSINFGHSWFCCPFDQSWNRKLCEREGVPERHNSKCIYFQVLPFLDLSIPVTQAVRGSRRSSFKKQVLKRGWTGSERKSRCVAVEVEQAEHTSSERGTFLLLAHNFIWTSPFHLGFQHLTRDFIPSIFSVLTQLFEKKSTSTFHLHSPSFINGEYNSVHFNFEKIFRELTDFDCEFESTDSNWNLRFTDKWVVWA